MTPQISVRDPLGPTNTKGRPKNASRIKSSLEMPKNEHVLTVRDWVIMPLVVQKESKLMASYHKNMSIAISVSRLKKSTLLLQVKKQMHVAIIG
uniref:Uncharacterized protein n=1 Tax=Lactuca sativa TaxID=4236 RepID=A0A9R1WIZ5_LACSA|nr:hypothetical protein LSAT_V11C200053580 [Lactuca sativa]